MMSSSGRLLLRWGAVTHEVWSAPIARASTASVGSASKQTLWPRAISRRASPIAGGTLPPPSHMAKRNRRDSPMFHVPSRRRSRHDGLEQFDHGPLRFGLVETEVLSPRPPRVDLGRAKDAGGVA